MPTVDSGTLVLTHEELNDKRNEQKARQAIANGQRVKIRVTGMYAAVLGAALADYEESGPVQKPRKSSSDSPEAQRDAKKEALKEAKRRAKEKALDAAKRRARERALAAAKRKSKEKMLAQKVAMRRKRAFEAAAELMTYAADDEKSAREMQKQLANIEREAPARSNDKGVAAALSVIDQEAVASLDSRTLAFLASSALEKASFTGDGAGADEDDESKILAPMVAGVDDAILITVIIAVTVVAAVGLAVVAAIALDGMSKGYGVKARNGQKIGIPGVFEWDNDVDLDLTPPD